MFETMAVVVGMMSFIEATTPEIVWLVGVESDAPDKITVSISCEIDMFASVQFGLDPGWHRTHGAPTLQKMLSKHAQDVYDRSCMPLTGILTDD